LDDGLDVMLGKGSGGQHRNKNDLLHHALHLFPNSLHRALGVSKR
jgi:hypothetical protein